MTFLEYPDREMLVVDVAQAIVSDLSSALTGAGRVSLAVPGGTTPAPIFDVLCAADLAWDRVDVMLTDERWVPETHPRSNTALIKQHLMQDRAAAAGFVPFFQDGLDAQAGAAHRAPELAAHLPISVLVLGMGADMHTASLFPGAHGLQEALAPDAPALCAVQAEGQEPRVSLSLAALNSAMAKHVVIFGDDKRAALEAAAELPVDRAPISGVLKGATVHWAA